MDLTYRHIEQIKMLHQVKSFARASRLLNLSQPALSRSISNLEERLGVRLFDRKHNDVTPTLFGRYILDKGENLLQELKLLNRDLHLLRDNQIGEIHVGCGPFPAEMFIGQALATFHGRYPKLDLQVRVGMTPELLGLLRERSLDVFVADTRTIEQEKDLEIRLFPQIQTYFCCSKKHPLCKMNDLSVKDVCQYPLAVMWFPESIFLMLEKLSGIKMVASSELPCGIIRCDNFTILLDIIDSTDAVGIACPQVIDKSGHKDQIHFLPMRFPEFMTQYGAVSLKGHTPPPAIDFLTQCMEDAAEALTKK